MPATDPAGPTYRLVLAVYVATLLTALAAGLVAARRAPSSVLVPVVVGTWLGGTVVVGAGLGVLGVPTTLSPRRLYGTGRSWGPALLGVLPVAVVVAGLVVSSLHVPIPAAVERQVGPLLFAGLAAPLGWLLRVMARNTEARARLAAGDVLEWRARPAARRRWLVYVLSGLFIAATLVGVGWFREPSFVGLLGFGFALAARGANEQHYWLGRRTLVYGNPQVMYLLDADAVAGVTREVDSLRIDRRGVRPALTIDMADLDEPEMVVAALNRWSGTT